MADDLKNSKVIRKKDPDFPAYLDFEKLRSEGIAHLGNLAGKLWTDHNVHDPGITILEILCYALLDLGYRTNLPETDLFTRNPDDKSKDNNFFTPAQILACNPLTITDYRKLLVDLEGVRNAWLEPATDVTDFCRSHRQPIPNDAGAYDTEEDCTCDEPFLNGLYHVYLDLENPPAGKDAQSFEDETVKRVKDALMAHRNLCEDFEDIYILCKLPMGVCADIELEEKAEADKVYLAMAEALRHFFTPSPRFYTLQQLLDRQKPIEAIFAGRPYNLTQSHGFVDTEEFEKLPLRKEIPLSDVYSVLLGVPGVKSVHKLALRLCDGGKTITDWKFKIHEKHIPEFSTACSDFRFSRNGQPLAVDFKKYEGLLALNFSHSGKVLYKTPSPYLDGEIPKGIYRNDLAHYYSIQNEFPKVYGIEEGGLPHDAPALRKAQALQLKGYLLFFDQLLANYLTQLSNIRSLFALSSSGEETMQQTYFTNQLTTVPELQKLLRFGTGNGTGPESLGAAGSTLLFPVNKKKLLALKKKGELKYLDLEKIAYCEKPGDTGTPLAIYTYPSLAEQATAVHQLKHDFYQELAASEFITTPGGDVFFYITTSSDEIVLLSKKYFKDIQAARLQATSVQYIGTFDDNYRIYPDGAGNFSFDIELNLVSFSKYLQLIAEDRDLYLQRRQGFLQHLLARFSEKFTDFALLSFGSFSNRHTKEATIKATEQFLTSYDNLSSNRGRAYNYLADKWNNHNTSGFENKVKAISGIGNLKRHSLCNFEVYQYEEQFEVSLRIAGHAFFTLNEKFATRTAAQEAAPTLFRLLADSSGYQVQELPQKHYAITLQHNQNVVATYPGKFTSADEALQVMTRLQQLFTAAPAAPEAIFVSHHIYYLQLLDSRGNVVRTSVRNYDSPAKARKAAEQLDTEINNRELWQSETESKKLSGSLFRDPHNTDPPQFIDSEGFKIDINDTILKKPDKFTYDLLDSGNRFRFSPLQEFDEDTQAREHAQNLLAWMTSAEHYQIRQSAITGKWMLYITVDAQDQAVCFTDFSSMEEARHMQNEILFIVYEHLYTLAVQELPHKWKYTYETGIEEAEHYTFESTKSYNTPAEARDAASAFRQALPRIQLQENKNEYRLAAGVTTRDFSAVKLVRTAEQNDNNIRKTVAEWQQVQAEVQRLQQSAAPEDFEASVTTDFLTQQGRYVYRLVDKDKVPAVYSESFPDKRSAIARLQELSRLKCEDYSYLEICLGGDIIRERKDPRTQATRYHYLIKAHNHHTGSGEELVLFESTTGYGSRTEAEQAFAANYALVLHLASALENYGKKISTEEKPVYSTDACNASESIVFIPKETLNLPELGGYDDAVIRSLIGLADVYPIRQVAYPSDAFSELFPCEEKPEKEKDCRTSEEQYVYYFRLNSTGSENDRATSPYWQSTAYYTSPEEAREAFHFFKLLLCYPGNFTVACDECAGDAADRYRIYLREVLAESTRRFGSEAEAWGETGVQQFICTAQAQDTFHTFLRKEDCCYSFFVACTGLYHPCRYDTPQKRAEVKCNLYQAISNSSNAGAYRLAQHPDGSGYVLTDEQGEPFARALIRDQYSSCASLVELLKKVNQKQVTYGTTEKGEMYVQDRETGLILVGPDGYERTRWQQTLEAFSCYFPVVKKTDGDTNKPAYCIEIKLPGFSPCSGEAETEEIPCGCREDEKVSPPACTVAWESPCCYATCEEALEALQQLEPLLLRYENYRSVFDCDCHEFGIALHSSPYEDTFADANRNRSYSHGEVVAVNPQCYTNPRMACEAVARAKELINSEGLHVVEHILLRPRCEADCSCHQTLSSCENKTNCCFEWAEPDEDPCAEQPAICFIPGADPYSFIATIALPAWPERFRKKENRLLLENILYREAPAHVLLRILWLAPHDFCCFESMYKNWGRWLGQHKNCTGDFTTCDFLDFLFNRNFECLHECAVCLPCEAEEPQADICFGESDDLTADPLKFQNQVSWLYCWSKPCEENYEFIPCSQEQREVEETDYDMILLSRNTPAAIPWIATEPEPDTASATEDETGDVTPAPENPAEDEAAGLAVLLKSRIAGYRSSAELLLEKTEDPSLVQKVKASLKAPVPSAKKTSELVAEITRLQRTKVIPKKQALDLIKNLLSYYLDKVYVGRQEPEMESIVQALEALPKSKKDREAIYRYWNPEALLAHAPGTDAEPIRKLLTDTTN